LFVSLAQKLLVFPITPLCHAPSGGTSQTLRVYLHSFRHCCLQKS